MERIDGVALDDWIAGRPAWRSVVEAFVQAAHGLAAAHDRDIVHRDFKPANAMIRADGRVQVLDFGLARALSGLPPPVDVRRGSTSSVDSGLTLDGEVAGTPVYMAPEQVVGNDVDARTDQFSFCVALYEALYGRRPFRGDRWPSLARSIVFDPVPARPRGPVPASLHAVVRRGLEKEPDRRFEDMRAVADALEQSLGTRRRLSRRAAWGVGGLVALAAWWGPSMQTQCDPHKRLAPVWNPRRAGDVTAHLERIDLGNEQGVIEGLERYANDWETAYVRACEAGADEDEATALDLTMLCLDMRLGALDSAASVLTEVTKGGAARALGLVDGLPEVADCASADVVRALAIPEDLSRSGETLAVAQAIERATDLGEVGQYVEALAEAVEAVGQADRAGLMRQRAEARLSHGHILRNLRQYSEAREQYEDAFVLAMEAKDERLAARIATELILVVGSDLTDFSAAQRWVSQVESYLAHSPEDAKMRRRFHNYVGAVRATEGNYDEALAQHEIALGYASREADPFSYGITVGYVARDLTKLGRDADAVERFEDAISVLSSTVGNTHPAVAAEYNELGTALVHLDRYEEALTAYQGAAARIEAVAGPDNLATVTAASNVASVLSELGRYDEAQVILEHAYEIQKQQGGPTDRATMVTELKLGMLAYGRADFAEARRLLVAASNNIERNLGPDHPELATAYTALGAALSADGREEESLAVLQRALRIREASLPADHDFLGASHYNVAIAMFNLGRLTEADAAINKAIEVGRRRPDFDPADIAVKRLVQANIAKEQQRYDEGIALLRDAIPILDEAAGRRPWFERQAADARFALAKMVAESGGDLLESRRLAAWARESYAGDPSRAEELVAPVDEFIATLPR